MNTIDTELLKTIWINNIVGKKSAKQNDQIKEFLYESYISRNEEILSTLQIKTPTSENLEFLQELITGFANIKSSAMGFFPIGILKSKQLTCAGNTLLTNTLLKNKDMEVMYARPTGHSLNIVTLDNKYYWVDTTNSILETVEIDLEKRETFSIAHIKSKSDKIIYKMVPILNSIDIIVNVFGNLEALKTQEDSDPLVKMYLSENQDIYKINFNDVKEYLYKEYFDFVRYDQEFKKEQERVRNLI